MGASCEDDPVNQRVHIEVFPPGEGNFVHAYVIEEINEEAELQTVEGIIYEISTYRIIELHCRYTKFRVVAVPGPGYKLDRWGGRHGQGSEDYIDLDLYPDTDLYIEAHFVPIHGASPSEWETPLDPGSEQPEPEEPEGDLDVDLEANIRITSEAIEDESGCGSIITIDYEAMDLTGGDRPVSYVQLNVDGEELTSWSGVPTEHYQNDTLIESGCSEFHLIQLTATNNEGGTVTTTKEVQVPPLSTHLGWSIIDAPGGGECRMQLYIGYEAVDLTTPDNPITNVIVKANDEVWDNSGAISTDHYENSFMTLVDCGHTYTIEIIGTDADGNKYTYRETIEIPEAGPPDEPPPPPPPPPPQTTLYAALAAGAQCTASGPECSCQLSISFDGKDLTVGDYPVTHVVLRVNGQVWHDSGSISTTHYHHVEQRTVDCGETFNLEVTVNNTLGQTVPSTGSITTPIP